MEDCQTVSGSNLTLTETSICFLYLYIHPHSLKQVAPFPSNTLRILVIVKPI